MGLTHRTPHTHHYLPRFTIVFGMTFAIALGLDVGVDGLRFMPVGLGATTIDRTLQRQGTKGDVPQRLSDAEIQSNMQALSEWELNGDVIQLQRKFGDFVEAVAFVNRLVEPAEAAGHHPDIAISYNTVMITLTTHDVGGLTDKDFALAAVISEIR